MKVSPEKIISIPIDGIVKVEAEKTADGATIALVAGVAGGSIIVYYGLMVLFFKIASAFFPPLF